MTQDRAYRIRLRLVGRGRRAPALLRPRSSIPRVVTAFLAVLGRTGKLEADSEAEAPASDVELRTSDSTFRLP